MDDLQPGKAAAEVALSRNLLPRVRVDASSQEDILNFCDLIKLYTAFPTLSPVLQSCYCDSSGNLHQADPQEGQAIEALGAPSIDPVLLMHAFKAIFNNKESSWEHAHELSRQLREEKRMGETNLGYGEIMPSTVFEVMREIKSEHECLRQAGGVVYDLGSGSGRVIFAACLAHNFEKAFGMEFLSSLHESALANLSQCWNKFDDSTCPVTCACTTDFHFLCADIRNIKGFKLDPPPSLLFCHATLFDNGKFTLARLSLFLPHTYSLWWW